MFLGFNTIASACDKFMSKRFLKNNRIGHIPSGGYSGNVKYSNKATMWLEYREQTDGCAIMHTSNVFEYRTAENPLIVDGFCDETRTVYEFFGCLFHGHTCLPFRDETALGGVTVAEGYE